MPGKGSSLSPFQLSPDMLFSPSHKPTNHQKPDCMGSLKKRRKAKIAKHKRRKRMKENRHKKRLRYKS
jgi:hypothetical protein